MGVTNDDTTGRTGVCGACGQRVEEALLLKGLMVRDRAGHRVPSPGIPTWRRLDRGPGSAKCPGTPTGQHDPGTPATGTAFQAPAGGSLRSDAPGA